MNKIIFKRFGKYLNHACWQDLIPHTPNTYTRRLKEHRAHLQPLSHSWFLQWYWYLSSDSTTRALSWRQMPPCPAGTRVVTVPSFAYYFTKKKKKNLTETGASTLCKWEKVTLWDRFPANRCTSCSLTETTGGVSDPGCWATGGLQAGEALTPQWALNSWLAKNTRPQEALGFWATGGPSTAQVEGEGRRKQANHMKVLEWEATGLPRVKGKRGAPTEITWARTLLRKGRNLPLWRAVSSSPREKASHRGSVWPRNSE